jgi:hypothetical protein
VGISLFNLTRWISLVNGFIHTVVIYSMSVSRVGLARIVIAQGAELDSSIPASHESSAMPAGGSEKREQIGITLGIDISQPNGRSGAKYTVDNRGPIFLLRVEEGIVVRTSLQEIHGHLFLMSALPELHFLEFAHSILEPLIVEEMGVDGLKEQGPALADVVTHGNRLRGPPHLRSIGELERGDGA